MKVLLVSSSFFPKVDGSTRCVYDHARKLAERSNVLYLVTRSVNIKGAGSFGTQTFEELEGIRIVRTKLSLRSGSKLNVDKIRLATEQAILILRLQRMMRFDVIHVHGFSALYAAIPCKLLYDVPVVITTHGTELLWPKWVRWKNPAEVKLGLLLEKIALNFCDVIIAQSPGVKKYMIQFYGEGIAPKIRLIHTGVDHQKFMPLEKLTSSPSILFAGALSEVKGLKCLIKAFAIVHARIPGSRLVLAGSGPSMQRYKALVAELNLEDSVQFLGPVRDDGKMISLYRDSDVVVLPSNVGGPISCTILEGLSSGRPVISTNVPGGIPDIVNDQVGALIESGDTNQLASELLKLLGDETYRKTIGSNARASVEQKYTLESMIDKLTLLYKEIKRN